MCNDGIRLYNAWAALVPQIETGHREQLHLMKVKTPKSERARRAYEAHRLKCKQCGADAIPGVEYYRRKGIKI